MIWYAVSVSNAKYFRSKLTIDDDGGYKGLFQ